MHVERVFKIYTGLTCAYGFLHACRRERRCATTGLSLIISAPLLWPAYAAADCLQWRERRHFPHHNAASVDENLMLPMSDDT